MTNVEANEVVRFVGNDDDCTHVIHENSTEIFSSIDSHNKGSSKLTLKNFVNFNWDQCYYHGQLIAMNITEQFIAYGFSKPNSSEGLVRIVKRDTNERALIKGFSGLVEDISFAHLHGTAMLACIDQTGTTYVYVVKEETYPSQKLKVYPLIQINEDLSQNYENKHLLSWCQFIPETVSYLTELEYEPTYSGKILAITRGPVVEIWHIGIASSLTSGPVGTNFDLDNSIDQNILNNIKNSVIKINLYDSEIISVSFSPDGLNIALALANGSVKFFQFSFENVSEPPNCLFFWNPAEVMALRSMLFLDNHKYSGDVELWKYVVTFSHHNELIVWSCETWKCLQKLTFIRPSLQKNPMKLSIDETGRYLFLNDIDNNLLYCMEVSVDINSPKKNIKIITVTEIMLQSPILNMIVVNAKIDHNDVNLIQHGGSGDYVNKYTTIINLFAIQPKSIQEGQLTISSPEVSIVEQFIEKKKIEPKSIFPKPPTLSVLMEPQVLSQVDSNAYEEKNIPDLNSMTIHKMVMEKLRLKGINLESGNTQSTPNAKEKNYVLNEIRDLSISNNKEHSILDQQPKEELEDSFPLLDVSKNDFHSKKMYSNDIEEEEKETLNHYTDVNSYETVNKGQPVNSYETVNKEQPVNYLETLETVETRMVEIYSTLQNLYSELRLMTKQQALIEKKIAQDNNEVALMLTNRLEPAIYNMGKKISEQSYKKAQVVIERQLDASHAKLVDIVKNSTTNKIDSELFTRNLVASLSPTLDAILKDLFMTTVIPKFEHACCSMFKQIDASFTERSLEYQNELKLLLNEEGNVNCKLENAFETFKTDMSNIIKHTEIKFLSAQNDIQNQLSCLLKESSLSNGETFIQNSEDITQQYYFLSRLIDNQEYSNAFEKALNASNLDLVIFVCEKVCPEELFKIPILKTPVVLSLIQQLSHDLQHNTELKQRYLDSAVSSLDYTSDHYKDNINLVLVKLDASLENFILQHPFNDFSRKFRMLKLAVKTIISLIVNGNSVI